MQHHLLRALPRSPAPAEVAWSVCGAHDNSTEFTPPTFRQAWLAAFIAWQPLSDLSTRRLYTMAVFSRMSFASVLPPFLWLSFPANKNQ